MKMPAEEFHRRAVRTCRKLLTEFRQMVTDVESWNENRPECPPMDCEPERVGIPKLEAALAAYEAEEFDRANRIFKEFSDTFERAVRDRSDIDG